MTSLWIRQETDYKIAVKRVDRILICGRYIVFISKSSNWLYRVSEAYHKLLSFITILSSGIGRPAYYAMPLVKELYNHKFEIITKNNI